jgi:hypothetical protein
MKTDIAFKTAITLAHQHEEVFVDYLRSFGLSAIVLSKGFRATLHNIKDYAHDIDLDVEGWRCQYKHRDVELKQLIAKNWRPFIDERSKAARTICDFYFLRFSDATIVVPYDPATWGVKQCLDRWDQSVKAYYVVNDLRACIPLSVWIKSFSIVC